MAKARMLLVEDDSSLAELLVWHFTREHFDVQHTIDGEEALLMAKETPPDIVLLDWMVEGISGIEVCRRLRRAPGRAGADRVPPAQAFPRTPGPCLLARAAARQRLGA